MLVIFPPFSHSPVSSFRVSYRKATSPTWTTMEVLCALVIIIIQTKRLPTVITMLNPRWLHHLPQHPHHGSEQHFSPTWQRQLNTRYHRYHRYHFIEYEELWGCILRRPSKAKKTEACRRHFPIFCCHRLECRRETSLGSASLTRSSTLQPREPVRLSSWFLTTMFANNVHLSSWSFNKTHAIMMRPSIINDWITKSNIKCTLTNSPFPVPFHQPSTSSSLPLLPSLLLTTLLLLAASANLWTILPTLPDVARGAVEDGDLGEEAKGRTKEKALNQRLGDIAQLIDRLEVTRRKCKNFKRVL